MIESSVTLPLLDFLEMRDIITSQEKIIGEVLSTGEQYTLNNITYTVVNPDKATKDLIESHRKYQEYKSILSMVLNKRTPDDKIILDYFKHDERFKDLASLLW